MVTLISLSEMIDAAIAAEDAARRVYLGFVRKFSSFPEVSEFWQTMADDESDHARILSSLYVHVVEADKHAPIDARMAEKARSLGNVDAAALLNSVKNLDDAYRVAYDIESSEVNTVFNFLTIRFLTQDESYDIISATIDRHLLRLAEFSRKFGGVEECSRVTASP